jgi:hypothetical protein
MVIAELNFKDPGSQDFDDRANLSPLELCLRYVIEQRHRVEQPEVSDHNASLAWSPKDESGGQARKILACPNDPCAANSSTPRASGNVEVYHVALAILVAATWHRLGSGCVREQQVTQLLGIMTRHAKYGLEYSSLVPPSEMLAAETIVAKLGNIDDGSVAVG